MKLAIVIVSVALLQASVVFAGNPYIRDTYADVKKVETAQKGHKDYRPLEKWAGEKFIFLPRSTGLQKSGYHGTLSNSQGAAHHPSYKELVGRIGTVTKVEGIGRFKITITMDDKW